MTLQKKKKKSTKCHVATKKEKKKKRNTDTARTEISGSLIREITSYVELQREGRFSAWKARLPAWQIPGMHCRKGSCSRTTLMQQQCFPICFWLNV